MGPGFGWVLFCTGVACAGAVRLQDAPLGILRGIRPSLLTVVPRAVCTLCSQCAFCANFVLTICVRCVFCGLTVFKICNLRRVNTGT